MTQPAPAVAPYVPSYANRYPYLTSAEYLAAPTGVDLSQLVPGGNEQAQAAAINTLLDAASSYADVICQQVLAATSDMQVGVYRVKRDRALHVPVDFTPLIEVTTVSLGAQPSSLQQLTDLSCLWLEPKVVRIPVGHGVGADLYTQVTYVNGWANTTLAGSVTAGAQTVTVASSIGIFPGLILSIYDDAIAATERVTVDPSYVQGSTTVPTTTALVNAHQAGTAISAMPRAVKQAVICLTTHLIKTRGAEALTLAAVTGGPSKTEDTEPGYTEEYEQAVDLLAPFKRVR